MSFSTDINEDVLANTARRCRERNIVIPTLSQQMHPEQIPADTRSRLANVGLWDVDPLNLFRITWKNEPVARGGGFNNGNWIEFPQELTRVPARIIGIVGKHFPTGAHKVGAAFGCLVPRIVSGQFDPTTQAAVWPSTGNFCRGGAYDCALLGCQAVAILPEEMSAERFEWLRSIGAEVIATPGCESNVKEIYDKCWEIRRDRPECVIFNQFEEFGNAIWHYHVTGGIVDEIFRRIADQGASDEPTRTLCLAAFVSATGSAGTIAAGDALKQEHPNMQIVAAEAMQCPTLLECGYGGHRIEGIGDKHVPWIHNVRNTDLVVAVDDEQCISLMRLFNNDVGRAMLAKEGIQQDMIDRLPDIGISCICNLVAAIKTAKYYELGPGDVIFTPLTDSMELYQSRLDDLDRTNGEYDRDQALRHFGRYIEAITTDHMRELHHRDRKALHNLKYFTWVEQQQRTVEDLDRLWSQDFWMEMFGSATDWDRSIEEFNRLVAAN